MPLNLLTPEDLNDDAPVAKPDAPSQGSAAVPDVFARSLLDVERTTRGMGSQYSIILEGIEADLADAQHTRSVVDQRIADLLRAKHAILAGVDVLNRKG